MCFGPELEMFNASSIVWPKKNGNPSAAAEARSVLPESQKFLAHTRPLEDLWFCDLHSSLPDCVHLSSDNYFRRIVSVSKLITRVHAPTMEGSGRQSLSPPPSLNEFEKNSKVSGKLNECECHVTYPQVHGMSEMTKRRSWPLEIQLFLVDIVSSWSSSPQNNSNRQEFSEFPLIIPLQ